MFVKGPLCTVWAYTEYDREGPVGPSHEVEVRDLVRGVVSTCPSTL